MCSERFTKLDNAYSTANPTSLNPTNQEGTNLASASIAVNVHTASHPN